MFFFSKLRMNRMQHNTEHTIEFCKKIATKLNKGDESCEFDF